MSDQEVHKTQKSRGQRLSRLLKSTVNPKAWAHLIKIVNYYNYTHVAELPRISRGADAKISPTASFANGHNIILGDRVSIGAGCNLWAGNGTAKVVLEDDVLLAPNVMIIASNYRFNDGSPVTEQAMNERDILIGKDVWLGYGAVVLAGARIGDGAIIGAGAIVRGTVEPNAIIAAVPPAVIGERFSDRPKAS